MAGPLFKTPKGATGVVHIINTTLRLGNVSASALVQPPVFGFDILPPMTTWSFLIEGSTGSKALFDLGVPPDLSSYSPPLFEDLEDSPWDIESTRNVVDILKDNGTDTSEIRSVIWSHSHWDHIGDITTFPGTTELVVGPGFKNAFLPGYPTNPSSILREAYFEGRNLREVNFAESPQLKIGGFDALDFFGDGSFYLLNTPGHDIGHISGLVRTTTSPDTFIFMGGDLCHHGGEIRPSPYNPIPDKVHLLKPEDTWVSGQLFKDINVQRSRKEDQAMFDPSSKVVADFAAAVKTIRDTQVADADENVFFVFAHDTSVGGVVDLFPLPANDWKAKGWREKARWGFLADLMPAAGGAISEVE